MPEQPPRVPSVGELLFGRVAPPQPVAPPRGPGTPGAAERQVPPPPAPLGFLQPYYEGAVDLVRGAVGDAEFEDSAARKAGALFAALPAAGPLKGAGRGLYSRIDELLGKLPKKGVHPNKLKSMLQSGASSEEVAYRNIPAFLKERGNEVVTPEAFQAHLEAHPPPQIRETRRGAAAGGAKNRYDAYVTELEGRYGVGYDSDALTLDERERISELWSAVQRQGGGRDLAPKYKTYSLPEGQEYSETLLRLPTTESHRLNAIREDLEELASLRSDVTTWRGEDRTAAWDRLTQERAALGGKPSAPTYISSHWDEPNILTHIRTTERTLAPEPMRSMEEVEKIIQDVVGASHPEHIASGGPGLARRQGLITPDEASAYGHSRGFTNFPNPPTGPRGHFLEEVQSDWHQAGKRSGYITPPTPEALARAEELRQQIKDSQDKLDVLNGRERQHLDAIDDARRAFARANLPPEWAHLESFNDAVQNDQRAIDAWRTARERWYGTPEAIALETAHGAAQAQAVEQGTSLRALEQELERLFPPDRMRVPDAPFKETWPDLALKHQLLETAKRPDLDWFGFTSGKTQADRYDLSKYVDSLQFKPYDDADYSLGELIGLDKDGYEVVRHGNVTRDQLADYVGHGPATALEERIVERERRRAYDRGEWGVEEDSGDGKFYLYDPNGELVYKYGGTPERFATRGGAEQRLEEILSESERTEGAPEISGLDLQMGGEGMKSFYDQQLPKKLEKLLKPFGATVERATVPTKKSQDVTLNGFAVYNEDGAYETARFPTEAEAQAFMERDPGTSYNIARGRRYSLRPTTWTEQQTLPADEPAWIVRLTPEIKERILKEGFPLMALAAAAGVTVLDDDEVGMPPPSPGFEEDYQ